MSPRLKVLVCTGASVLAVVTTIRGDQTSSQQPTFVSGIQAVRVDVHVTLDGRPLSDVLQDEVQVYEDGALQTIQTFERVTFARPGSAPTTAAGTLSRSRELVIDPRSRVFVLFLDSRHTSYLDPAVQARFPIIRTLQKLIGPDDLVAFATPDTRPDELSFDRGLAGLARLEGTWTYSVLHPDPGMQRDPKQELYETCYPPHPGDTRAREMLHRYWEKTAFDALEDLTSYLGALRQEPTHIFAITDGWRIFTENPKLMEAPGGPRLPQLPLGGRGREGVGVITERGAVPLSEATYRACEADLLTLASLDHRERLREIAARANASNVSFYPISARGLTTTSATSPPSSNVPYQNTTRLFGDALLRGLADDTGGLAIVNTNNLEPLLENMMTRTSSFYLVSYSSTNSALDGKYRRIAVKVNRPGVAVRARQGYVATRPLETRAVQPPDSASKPDPVRAAIGALESQVRLAAEGTAAAARGAVSSEVAVFRRGSSATLPFERTADPRFRRNERLRVAVQMRGTTDPTARLLDRRGGMLMALTQITERPDATGAWTVDLALASLAIGDYAIEIISDDDIRVVAFRIVP